MHLRETFGSDLKSQALKNCLVFDIYAGLTKTVASPLQVQRRAH